jgi:hypothetical protein
MLTHVRFTEILFQKGWIGNASACNHDKEIAVGNLSPGAFALLRWINTR